MKAMSAVKGLLSFDPGGTTGICILSLNLDDKVGKLIRYGEFPTFSGLDHVKNAYVIDGDWDLVFENFIVVHAKNNNNTPIEVIGAIKYWAASSMNFTRIHSQQPGERLFIEKRFNRPYTHVTSHSRSAMLHGMAYAFKHYDIFEWDWAARGARIF